MQTHACWVAMILVTSPVAPAPAAVDLVTPPTREGTQLIIYNSEDITMVKGAFGRR
jgi:hypothetical protein